MSVYLGFALLAASTIDVQAQDLRLDKEGTLLARGQVVIRWRGRVFKANQARLDRQRKRITLVGGVNTEESGAILQCDELELSQGLIEAQIIDLARDLKAKRTDSTTTLQPHLVKTGSQAAYLTHTTIKSLQNTYARELLF